MKVDFLSTKLRRLCETPREAQRVLGADGAFKLERRLATLSSVPNLAELFRASGGRPHQLKGTRSEQFALDLARGHRLVFEPTGDFLRHEDGGLERATVTAILVVFIGDYHA